MSQQRAETPAGLPWPPADAYSEWGAEGAGEISRESGVVESCFCPVIDKPCKIV